MDVLVVWASQIKAAIEPKILVILNAHLLFLFVATTSPFRLNAPHRPRVMSRAFEMWMPKANTLGIPFTRGLALFPRKWEVQNSLGWRILSMANSSTFNPLLCARRCCCWIHRWFQCWIHGWFQCWICRRGQCRICRRVQCRICRRGQCRICRRG